MAEDNDDAIPYCIATGDIKKLVSFFTGRGQLLEALLIAQVQGDNFWRAALKVHKRKELSNDLDGRVNIDVNIITSISWEDNEVDLFFRERVRGTFMHLKALQLTT